MSSATQAEALSEQLRRNWTLEAPEETTINLLGLSSIEDATDGAFEISDDKQCLHVLYSARAKQSPTDIAVHAWDGTLTYEELDSQSSILATYLQHCSIVLRREASVGLLFEKSCWMVVACLGVLKAGGTCVPLDLRDPISRLRTMVQDVEASYILCSRGYQSLAGSLGIPVVVDGALLLRVTTDPGNSWHNNPSTAAFVMYTSGSSGSPKGVVQEHGALCYSITRLARELRYTSKSRVLQFAAYTFDVSIGDMFATFIAGACLCVPSEDSRINHLTRYMVEERITHACLTPTMARHLRPDELTGLEVLALGGEPMTRTDVQHWQGRTNLVNIYGVTEACIWCMAAYTTDLNAEPSNVGAGFATTPHIVDPEDPERRVATGEVGELLLSSPSLARGYLGDDYRTAQQFMSAPAWALHLGLPSNTRFYKTGDMARYADDGSKAVHILGRKDAQIKIHGHRVERGEVEHHISQILGGTEVAVENVLFIDPDKHNEETSMLVGFICLGDDFFPDDCVSEKSCAKRRFVQDAKALAAGLPAFLPQYMIPRSYLPIRQLPRTPTGKTDRKKLRECASRLTRKQLLAYQDHVAQEQPSQEPPVNNIAGLNEKERLLQALWIEVLNLSNQWEIVPSSDFFQLGGNSASAMRLVSAARAKGLPLSIVDVFQMPSLRAMAAALDLGVEDDDDEN